MTEDYDFTYISYGAGVQSTAMLLLSSLGLLDVPKADVAIFADTGDEPQWVYDSIERLRRWPRLRTPIICVQKGHLLSDATNPEGKRFASIPLFITGDNGKTAMIRRQCTREYKIEPIEKAVRKFLGYKPRQRVKESVRCLIGISFDEVVRMKPSRTRWITNAWPLVDAKLRRDDCVKIVEEHLGFTPQRSACVYCPYRNEASWLQLKRDHPAEFERACEADEAMRELRGLKRQGFVHRSLKPLREVEFAHEKQSTFGEFTEECEGMCGV